ncbi:hypothetical protein Tco_0545584 [Tanacetum coccineum]
MEPDINNMTLNEYLMYEERNRDLARSYTSRKSVAPMRNIIWLYPDSDEEDEEYCSLPPLLPCFQTPQPCVIINFVHHNSHNEVDIDNMTLEEYARYEVAMSNEKDSSLEEILDDLFRIGAKNLRKTEHKVPHRCDDKTIDITNYEDSDHEGCELTDLPIFSASNEFASICEQVEENIDINIAEEKEQVPMKDVEMDKNHDIDHSSTKEVLQ